MKRLNLLFLCTILTFNTFSQEFKKYNNGLIYSPKTMNQLTTIVDSLNLKYKICEKDKVYHSKFQTIGHVISLDSLTVEATKDLENNISFDAFMQKYPFAKMDSNQVIVLFAYRNRENERLSEFHQINIKGYGSSIEYKTKQDEDYSGSKWVYNQHENSTKEWSGWDAMYFTMSMTSTALPMEYNEQIGYSECLIDTNSSKLFDDAKTGNFEFPKNWEKLSDSKKKKLLNEMRKTKVIGYCSMDGSPRDHAKNIAILSADLANWEVFLKAHLDIMNDRFERMSDGSYAWEARKTYLKELEELNIDVTNLILGITYRIENPASQHYYGRISRLGKALSDTKEKDILENKLAEIIKNDSLDLYNRILVMYLFEHYIYNLEKEENQISSINTFKIAISTLPNFISKEIETPKIKNKEDE